MLMFFLEKSGLIGLVGLVSFLNGMEIRISGISGIRLLFEWEWIRDDAAARSRCGDRVMRAVIGIAAQTQHKQTKHFRARL